MKKTFFGAAIVFQMLMVFGLSGTAQAEGFNRCYACATAANGRLRLVGSPNECLNSEEYVNLCNSLDECSSGDIPTIEGSWSLTTKKVGIRTTADTVLGSEQAVLVVAQQDNGMFWGQLFTDEPRNITGAIVGNKITINVEDMSVIHAFLCGNAIAGVVMDQNHDDQLFATRFTGTREESN